MSADPIVADILQRMEIAKGVNLDDYAEAEEGQHIRNAADFEAEVWEELNAPPTAKGGLMPWATTHNDCQIRKGELSIWAGKRGSGKSLITSQVMTGLISQGQKAVIASMEMPIRITLARMAMQALGQAKLTQQYAHEFFRFMDSKLFVYQQDGVVPARRLLGLTRYAITEMGIENIVIDSLMMVGVNGKSSFDKMESQGQFVRDLAAIARDTGCHVHLVCHLRKGDGSQRGNEADDVKGAGEITDLASCVYIVSPNRKKAEEKNKPVHEQKQSLLDEPDVFMSVEKNRNGPSGATFGLFSHSSLQFLTKDNRVLRMLDGIKTSFV